MARRKSKKKGLHPGVAVVFLVASGAFVTRPYWSPTSTPGEGGGLQVATVDPDMGIENSAEGENIVWLDLLDEFGSFDGQAQVAHSFSTKVEKLQFAAPAGETQPYQSGRWTGGDPPSVRVGVIMVSEDSRRAVLNGAVLGVGQYLGAGDAIVTAIRRGSVLIRWRNRDLTYDLDSAAPREFRSELERRLLQAEAKGASENDASGTKDKE